MLEQELMDEGLIASRSDIQFMREVVRCYAEAHGWVSHRLMIDQHVRSFLRHPSPLYEQMVTYHRQAVENRKLARMRLFYGTSMALTLVAVVGLWFAMRT